MNYLSDLEHYRPKNFLNRQSFLIFLMANLKWFFEFDNNHGKKKFLRDFNPLTPNDPYRGRTSPLNSKRCILYIYSTNIGTEYSKHGISSTVFFIQNEVCFIILTYLVLVLFTFYIQDVLKLKKNNSGAKRLTIAREKTLSYSSANAQICIEMMRNRPEIYMIDLSEK